MKTITACAALNEGMVGADTLINTGRNDPNFYRLPTDVREAQISRIMVDAKQRFNHEACAAEYIKIYEEMLQRPLTELFDGGNENQNPYTNGGM